MRNAAYFIPIAAIPVQGAQGAIQHGPETSTVLMLAAGVLLMLMSALRRAKSGSKNVAGER